MNANAIIMALNRKGTSTMEMDVSRNARVCKALGDLNRMEIVSILMEGEQCASALLNMLMIEQPTLSHHMRILIDAEVVFLRKDGKWSYYMLNKECLSYISKEIMVIAEAGLTRQEHKEYIEHKRNEKPRKARRTSAKTKEE